MSSERFITDTNVCRLVLFTLLLGLLPMAVAQEANHSILGQAYVLGSRVSILESQVP